MMILGKKLLKNLSLENGLEKISRNLYQYTSANGTKKKIQTW